MAGTVPVSGSLSMEDLAATLTKNEQLGFEQVTALSIDSRKRAISLLQSVRLNNSAHFRYALLAA